MNQLEVEIVIDTTPGGMARHTFLRALSPRQGPRSIGDVTQVAEHRWQARVEGEPLERATPHRSYEMAEQELLRRAGLGAYAITYREVRA